MYDYQHYYYTSGHYGIGCALFLSRRRPHTCRAPCQIGRYLEMAFTAPLRRHAGKPAMVSLLRHLRPRRELGIAARPLAFFWHDILHFSSMKLRIISLKITSSANSALSTIYAALSSPEGIFEPTVSRAFLIIEGITSTYRPSRRPLFTSAAIVDIITSTTIRSPAKRATIGLAAIMLIDDADSFAFFLIAPF